MKKTLSTILLFLAIAVFSAQAQPLSVETIEFGTAVENREIVGADSVFANTVGQIYCFTHITGAEEDTRVTHIWYFDNEEMARVDLTIRSNNWRTWSAKNILEGWTGNWSVDVLGPDGEVLVTESFRVETGDQ